MIAARKVAEFEYRGFQCTIKKVGGDPDPDQALVLRRIGDVFPSMLTRSKEWVNGYMRGPLTVRNERAAMEAGARAHRGFTYSEEHTDGTVTLGFDTGFLDDNPETQNVEYVDVAIRDAVDSLYEAGVVKTKEEMSHGK